MNLKTIFKGLSKLFDWLWNINLVLGIAAIVLVSVNAFSNKKVITANYLGKFMVKTEQLGHIESKLGKTGIFINEFSATPSVLIDSKANLPLTYGYIIYILCIVLGFNFQLMNLFKELNNSIKQGTPFTDNISARFKSLATYSFIFFTIGLVLSLVKLALINQIKFHNMILKPVFDNQVMNLAWIGIGFFILSGIFKIGFQLKTENDLTI